MKLFLMQIGLFAGVSGRLFCVRLSSLSILLALFVTQFCMDLGLAAAF